MTTNTVTDEVRTSNTNEDAWTKLSVNLPAKWQAANTNAISQNELDAFEYAWDMAYENRALLQEEKWKQLGW